MANRVNMVNMVNTVYMVNKVKMVKKNVNMVVTQAMQIVDMGNTLGTGNANGKHGKKMVTWI